MKKVVVSIVTILLTISAFASNKCDKKVFRAYKNYIEKQTRNEFDGVRQISLLEANQTLARSQELSDSQKAQALKEIIKPNVIVYEGESNYMSGTGLDILIVDSQSCKILKKFFWYAE